MKTKETKIISLLVGICVGAVALLVAGCKEDCNCTETAIETPQDLLPVDWENYNSVYTVYWNYTTHNCSQAGLTERIIKVEGWLLQIENSLYLADESRPTSTNSIVSVSVRAQDVADFLKIKLKTVGLPCRCYVTGELLIGIIQEGGLLDEDHPCNCASCITYPVIGIRDVNDIIFE